MRFGPSSTRKLRFTPLETELFQNALQGEDFHKLHLVGFGLYLY